MLKLSESSPGFFSIGLTIAVINDDGTVPERREVVSIDVINGAMDGRQLLTRLVGRGSR